MQAREAAAEWLKGLVQARSGRVALYWYAVLEAAIVPVPLEAVLAPYMQARRDIMWRLAAIGVAGYLTVAMAGYLAGALLFEPVALPIIDALGWRDALEDTQARLATGGVLVMMLLVALPIPTLVVHVGAGSLGMPIEHVISAVLVVRGGRYFGTGVLVWRFGDRAVAWYRARWPQPPRW